MKNALKAIVENDTVRIGMILLLSIFIVDYKVNRLQEELIKIKNFMGCCL